MIGDAAEDIGEPGLRIDAIKFGCFDRCVGNGGGFTSRATPHWLRRTMKLFNTKGGGGTPAPWEPIKNLIVEGPYRYVRNPMLLGVNLFLIAEALLLRSMPILLWMIAFVALNTVYFALSEEPQLEKRFGKAYADYRLNVPRWIPRLSPYKGGTEE